MSDNTNTITRLMSGRALDERAGSRTSGTGGWAGRTVERDERDEQDERDGRKRRSLAIKSFTADVRRVRDKRHNTEWCIVMVESDTGPVVRQG